jgi:hypothetical protein
MVPQSISMEEEKIATSVGLSLDLGLFACRQRTDELADLPCVGPSCEVNSAVLLDMVLGCSGGKTHSRRGARAKKHAERVVDEAKRAVLHDMRLVSQLLDCGVLRLQALRHAYDITSIIQPRMSQRPQEPK